MSYKLNGASILRLSDRVVIPVDPGNRDYEEYLGWVAAGNTSQPADPPPPPTADWRGFLEAMRETTVFAALRGQARANVAANALATELRTALGEAALGMVDEAPMQLLLSELLPSLTLAQKAEIQAGINAYSIPLTVS